MSVSKIIFRVDGGHQIGMGHIMRCLRLGAQILKSNDAHIAFVTSTPEFFNSSFRNYIPNGELIPVDINRFDNITDVYNKISPHVIISDLNLRNHIDRYLELTGKFPYHVNIAEPHLNHFPFGLVVFPSIIPVKPKCACESKAEYLAGAKYLLIDPRLNEIKQPSFENISPLKVLVSPGGADPFRATEKIIEILKSCDFNSSEINFNLVLGPAKPDKDLIIEQTRNINYVSITDSPSDLFELISQSHVVISSGGTTVYETIAASRPTWVVPQIEFEQRIGEILLEKKAIPGVGLESIKMDFLDKLPEVRLNPDSLMTYIESGKRLIDGRGMIRVADKIVSALGAMRISP